MKHGKKLITLSVLLIICFSSRIFATGCGIQAGTEPGFLINEDSVKFEHIIENITGTIRFSRIPMTMGFGFLAGKESSDLSFGLSAFADYYPVDIQLKNTWNFFSGFGASGSVLTSDFENYTLSAGARFFAGTNYLLDDNFLELYVQQNIVPTYIRSIGQSDSKSAFMLCFPLEAGIRMHF